MATDRVLISCPLIQDRIGEYDDVFSSNDVAYDVADVEQQLSEEDLLDVVDAYDGILAGDDELTGRVLRAADRLRVVSKWGIGLDNVALDAASEEGISVYNTPGAFADEVADVVLGYVLMLTRRLHDVDTAVRRGEWYCPRGVSLAGRTMGVVGVGSIGSEVVRRAAAHGMDVVGHDVVDIDPDLREETGVEQVPREELFERADVVSLNCPLTPDTHHVVDEAAIDRIGPDGFLVNTARGQLVDQGALAEALLEDRLAGAALDVFEEEPLSASDPLTEFDRVVLGSHNAQNTTEAVQRTNTRAVENLVQGLVESR